MVLEVQIKKKICDYIYIKPRSIDEVAKFIGKNWRTADRYIEKIAEEDGCISVRTFREGSRGALKIVFWTNVENIHSSSFQESLFRKIELGTEKTDFDPFDIYQYVDEKKKRAFKESFEKIDESKSQDLYSLLESAENTLYVFSGNLSWINMSEKGSKIITAVEDAAKRNVQIKIICRVDPASMNNLSRVYQINTKIGKEAIEVRHARQPLRGFIVDRKSARFKDEKLSNKYLPGELPSNTRIFVEIFDEEWVDWLIKVFYNLFRTSIDAKKRMEELKKLSL